MKEDIYELCQEQAKEIDRLRSQVNALGGMAHFLYWIVAQHEGSFVLDKSTMQTPPTGALERIDLPDGSILFKAEA